MYPLKRIAEVIENNIEGKRDGSIRVRILPELSTVSNANDLPIAYPISQSGVGVSSQVGEHNVPDKNSKIYVYIMSNTWSEIRYNGESPYSKDLYIYEDLETLLQNVVEEDKPSFEYPQPIFKSTRDNSTFFHNTDNGDIGLVHKSGLYVMIKSEGDLVIRKGNDYHLRITKDANSKWNIESKSNTFSIDADDLKIKVANSIELKKGEEGLDNVVKFTPLEEILKELLSHKHVAPHGQTTPAVRDDLSPLTTLNSKLRDLGSETTKTS